MTESTLIDLLDPIVAEHGLEIDELKIVRAGKHSVLRISLDGDGSEGHGPDLDQIADATRAISHALDEMCIRDRTCAACRRCWAMPR